MPLPNAYGPGAQPGLSAEEEIAYSVINEILPALRQLLAVLDSLSQTWNTPGNDIPDKIVTAAQSGQPLAGYAADDWARWGQIFLAVGTFLDTPATVTLPGGATDQTTPRAVLQRRYVKQEAQA
jgi:hypothetical protein